MCVLLRGSQVYHEHGTDSQEVRKFVVFRPQCASLKTLWDRENSKQKAAVIPSSKKRQSTKHMSPEEIARQVAAKLAALEPSPILMNKKHTRASMPIPPPPAKDGKY